MEMTLAEVAKLIGGEVKGNPGAVIRKLSSLENADGESLSFFSDSRRFEALEKSRAAGTIIGKSFARKLVCSTSLILVDNAYQSFVQILDIFNPKKKERNGIEQPSFVDPSAVIGENVYIGAFSYLAEGVKLGDNVKIFPHTYVGEHCEVGSGTVLYPGVRLYSFCVIGKQCVIHSGSVIGSDGFGFLPRPDGEAIPIPQIGNVVLGDRVNIGANSVIDCSTMESTRVGEGVKMDNLVQIGHNVVIGDHTLIASQTGIAGSAQVGKHVRLAGQSGVSGHLKIADRTTLLGKSSVFRDTKEGDILMGGPAFSYRTFWKAQKYFQRISELFEKDRKKPESKDD